MRSNVSTSIAIGLFGIALFSAPVSAQTTVPIAIITVPVHLHNLDTEFYANSPFNVQCSLYNMAGGQIGTAIVPVPVVVTPATTTTRSTFNFDGNVVLHFNQKPMIDVGQASNDPEGAAQVAAQAAIKSLGKYECVLGGPDASLTHLARTKEVVREVIISTTSPPSTHVTGGIGK
jgi:hypothetical protein